jgi:hypothetical protein
MIVRLPDITLVAIDSVAHSLTRRAVEDTLHQIEPANTIICSDRVEAVPGGAEWVRCEPLRSLHAFSAVVWYRLPRLIKTRHILLVPIDRGTTRVSGIPCS